MTKKSFDCVEFKRNQQEMLWKEAGETFEGLIKLLDKKKETNELIKYFTESKSSKFNLIQYK